MHQWDGFEREAQRVYRLVDASLDKGASPTRLVEGVLGAGTLRWASGDWLRGGGALVRIGSSWRVYLNRCHPIGNLRFVALHELAHYLLGPGGSEDDCDALAACLLAPRPAVERALEEIAHRDAKPAKVYSEIGAWFRCTDSFAAMRHAEVTDAPLALITPAKARVRGAPYPWPRDLGELARTPGPGLRKARLRDDPQRVAISASQR